MSGISLLHKYVRRVASSDPRHLPGATTKYANLKRAASVASNYSQFGPRQDPLAHKVARIAKFQASQVNRDFQGLPAAHSVTTTKRSSPVAGHTSPAQANMNMGGSAVSSSPATISDMRHALFNEPGSKGPAHMLRHALYAPDQPGALPTAKMKRVYNKVIDRQVRKNKVLDTGPRGGRFYISENGTKVYVK